MGAPIPQHSPPPPINNVDQHRFTLVRLSDTCVYCGNDPVLAECSMCLSFVTVVDQDDRNPLELDSENPICSECNEQLCVCSATY
jgi:hypothetical protein